MIQSWYVKGRWLGIEGPLPYLVMLGIIKRSGRSEILLKDIVHTRYSVNGKKIYVKDKNDRVFGLPYASWDAIGEVAPKDLIPALGWCNDRGTYAYLHQNRIVKLSPKGELVTVPENLWQKNWSICPVTLLHKMEDV